MTPEQHAQELRKQGLTYAEIGRRLNTHPGKAWILCNRARHRVNTNESAARYYKRGRIALTDMEPNK